jgi:hypothetical protein
VWDNTVREDGTVGTSIRTELPRTSR